MRRARGESRAEGCGGRRGRQPGVGGRTIQPPCMPCGMRAPAAVVPGAACVARRPAAAGPRAAAAVAFACCGCGRRGVNGVDRGWRGRRRSGFLGVPKRLAAGEAPQSPGRAARATPLYSARHRASDTLSLSQAHSLTPPTITQAERSRHPSEDAPRPRSPTRHHGRVRDGSPGADSRGLGRGRPLCALPLEARQRGQDGCRELL